MLSELRIRGLGVIEDARVELAPGLNVLTGETGAGKTMVVTALGLLMGQKADAGLVRAGSRGLDVQGWWCADPEHPVRRAAAEAGAELAADEDVVTGRSISTAGRSRAILAGRGVSASLLAEESARMVALHGQADQWQLARPASQRELLDRFGGQALVRARDEVARQVSRWRELRAEVARLAQEDREALQRAEVLRAGLEAIEAVSPAPGEEGELRVQEERLAHADTLIAATDALHTALVGEGLGGAVGGVETPNVASLLAQARSAAGPALEHDLELAGFDQRAQELAYLATDLAADLAGYGSRIEADPAGLATVQERRAALAGLTRRYGETIDAVLDWSREAAQELYLIDTTDERREAAAAELAQVSVSLGAAMDRLTGLRTEAATRLGELATAELAHLAMGKATLTVRVTPLPPGEEYLEHEGRRVAVHRHGADDVELQLRANPGAPARSVARAASGGELSRVMLALELVCGGEVPTYVFDEVDAGVGGASAVEIGARLARLADQAQVIVVTHLAQVAAFADRHLVVRKDTEGQVTSSDVLAVEGPERITEVARMLSGEATETALEHAQELVERSVAQRGLARKEHR